MRPFHAAARLADRPSERRHRQTSVRSTPIVAPRVREFVFVAQNADNLVMIGSSTNPFVRIEALRRDARMDVELAFVGVVKGPIAEIRRRVLDILDDHDCGNHWFDVSTDHVVGLLHRAAFKLDGKITQLELDEAADLIAGPVMRSVIQPASQLEPRLIPHTQEPAARRPVWDRLAAIFAPTKFKVSALGFVLFFVLIAQFLSPKY